MTFLLQIEIWEIILPNPVLCDYILRTNSNVIKNCIANCNENDANYSSTNFVFCSVLQFNAITEHLFLNCTVIITNKGCPNCVYTIIGRVEIYVCDYAIYISNLIFSKFDSIYSLFYLYFYFLGTVTIFASSVQVLSSEQTAAVECYDHVSVAIDRIAFLILYLFSLVI